MKTIGLLGGMSWESTVIYYTRINEWMNHYLGSFHSAKIKLSSVDFEEIENCQSMNDWHKSGEILGKEALLLEQAGADFLVICTNTMHKVVPQIEEYLSIPILHIVDMTVLELQDMQIRKVMLLGTKYTMTQDFYKQKILEMGIEVWVPGSNDIEKVNEIIFDELCQGVLLPESKETFLKIIEQGIRAGVDGVILGCTEIGLLIKQGDVGIPVFDTTEIHSKKAVEFALNG